MKTSKEAKPSNKIEKDITKTQLTNAGAGRPKGALNKTTQAAKDAIAEAAEMLGGVDRLVEWAKEDSGNERVFWGTIYPKLLPLQVNANLSGELQHRFEVSFGKG